MTVNDTTNGDCSLHVDQEEDIDQVVDDQQWNVVVKECRLYAHRDRTDDGKDDGNGFPNGTEPRVW